MYDKREIKFRLRIDNKIVGYEKWYGGEYHNGVFGTVRGIWLYSKDGIHNWDSKYIKHNKKDQYTDLHDKNNKETYKGDIIRADKDRLIYFVEWNQKRSGWMFNDNGRTSEDFIGEGIKEKEFKIIGNIIENPELLK